MNRSKQNIPVIALRGMVVLPGMLIHFDINRDITKKAVEKAMLDDQIVFLTAQKNPEIESPDQNDLYEHGCLAVVKQLIKLPGDVYRVLVSGIGRAELLELDQSEGYLSAKINVYEDISAEDLSEYEVEAMVRSMHDLLEVYTTEDSKFSKELLKKLKKIDELEKLLTQTTVVLPMSEENKQSILEVEDIVALFHRLSVILSEEIEVIRIRKELQKRVKERVDKNQKEYLLREQLKVIREELGESNSSADADQFVTKAKRLVASSEVKEKILKEIERFRNVSGSPSESAVIRGYIETLLALPWDKTSEDFENIKYAQKVLDAEHYGLEKVKERVLEFLAVRQLSKKTQSPVICLVGPPGIGKTSIARSIAHALNKEYVRISLGGVHDEAEIREKIEEVYGFVPVRLMYLPKNTVFYLKFLRN